MIATPRKTLPVLIVAGAMALIAGGAVAEVPSKKATAAGLYVTAAQAADMLADPDVVFVDVRSQAEVTFLGLPQRANVNIPLMVFPEFASYDAEAGTYKLEANPSFAEDFMAFAEAEGIGPDTAIILFCRSGSRSAKAANMLTDLGFSRVFTMIDGYEGDTAKDGPAAGQRVVNGWKNAGLDWSYRIDGAQLYPGDR